MTPGLATVPVATPPVAAALQPTPTLPTKPTTAFDTRHPVLVAAAAEFLASERPNEFLQAHLNTGLHQPLAARLQGQREPAKCLSVLREAAAQEVPDNVTSIAVPSAKLHLLDIRSMTKKDFKIPAIWGGAIFVSVGVLGFLAPNWALQLGLTIVGGGVGAAVTAAGSVFNTYTRILTERLKAVTGALEQRGQAQTEQELATATKEAALELLDKLNDADTQNEFFKQNPKLYLKYLLEFLKPRYVATQQIAEQKIAELQAKVDALKALNESEALQELPERVRTEEVLANTALIAKEETEIAQQRTLIESIQAAIQIVENEAATVQNILEALRPLETYIEEAARAREEAAAATREAAILRLRLIAAIQESLDSLHDTTRVVGLHLIAQARTQAELYCPTIAELEV